MIDAMRAASPSPVDVLTYDAFGAERTAERLGPVDGSRGTVLMLSGLAMFGLDAQRPAARDLLAFGDELATAIVGSGRCVIRPLAFDADRDADGCIAAATALVELARAHAPAPLVVLGLSAAAPLLAVVGAGARCEGFVLVSPPILETYGNRPDRLDLPLAEALGIPPLIASELGAAAPMHVGASVSPRALVVHGAADVIVPRLGPYHQPLCAIYSRRCLPLIADLLAEGEAKVDRFYDRVVLHEVPEARLRRVDPDLHAFLNVNTPADLEMVAALMAAGPRGAGPPPLH